MTQSDPPPEMPDLGGKIPEAWNELIDHLGGVEADSRKRQELEAQLRVWILFTDLRSRQLRAKSTEAHAKALLTATRVLAAFTLLLAFATMAAAFIVKP